MGTKQDKQMEKYLRAIGRRLHMSRENKNRVMSDLHSSIESRWEAGQTNGDIFQELGNPRKAAQDLNRQLSQYTYQKNPWRWACLGLSVISFFVLAFRGGTQLLLWLFNRQINTDSASLGIIGGADGPTAVFVTASGTPGADQLLFPALLLAMGLLGFYALGHIQKNRHEDSQTPEE